jgi:prolyl-tRNA editing enzyme YbaK/EbsC (Cys-tRNA(Pro) deacylase)
VTVLERASVLRVRAALRAAGVAGEVVVLDATTRTAQDAATALGVAVGQIASSIVFVLDDESPLLVITSGRHRVDPVMVGESLGVAGLARADADYVKTWSGFSIGGVSPVGWCRPGPDSLGASGSLTTPRVVIDMALNDYDVVWAAGGHPHAVFPTTFDELRGATSATPLRVASD